jgi:sterol desaturase/sphingolipid hydroxylase (fatty acid hydroxylase superfamily)
MNIALQGFLIGGGLALVLVIFEYLAITREVAERSKRLARRQDWDQNQRSRMRGMVSFGAAMPFAFALAAWWMWG